MTSSNLPKAGAKSATKPSTLNASPWKYIGFTPANSMFLLAAFVITPLLFATDAWESWVVPAYLIIGAVMAVVIGVLFMLLGSTWEDSGLKRGVSK